MENIERAVFASALLLTVSNIFIYSWFEARDRYLNTGIWVLRLTAVLPALVVIVWAIYQMAADRQSPLAMTLFVTGMMLIAAAIQLLSLLLRKQLVSGKQEKSNGGGTD